MKKRQDTCSKMVRVLSPVQKVPDIVSIRFLILPEFMVLLCFRCHSQHILADLAAFIAIGLIVGNAVVDDIS